PGRVHARGVGRDRRRPRCQRRPAARRRRARARPGRAGGRRAAGGEWRQPSQRRRVGEDLQESCGGERRECAAPAGRDRRPARAQRGGEDHDVLHDHRPDTARRRAHRARRTGHHRGADVPPGADGDRLPRPGAVGVPQAHRGGQRPGHPRDPAAGGRRAPRAAVAAARRAGDQAFATAEGVPALGGRTTPPRDHPGARDRAQVHAARRALRRRGSDRGARHPDHRGRVAAPRHRRIDHRPQRGADPRYRGPRLHHVRREGAGGGHGPRAGVRRPRGAPVSRAHPHRALARAPHTGGMKTGLQQHAALSQHLRINPRLYQAMDLLYMPLLDLQQHLKQELLGNPFLELAEPEEETELPLTQDGVEEKKETENNDEPNWEDILLDDGSDQGTPPRDMSEAREYVEPVPVESKDLSHHLRDQMRLLELTPRQQLLAEEFIGNIAEDGYLGASPEEIVRGANQLLEEHAVEAEGDEKPQLFTLAEAEEMLRIIQKLDPPGVGARDLRECLLLQLEARNETGTLAYRLVKEAFEDLKAHRWSDLGKRFGLDAAEVQRVADELARLDPKPGLQYSAASDAYIIPDLVVEKIDGKYHVFLNDGGLPRLRISKTYQEIARDKKKFQGENKDFINQRLNSAHWMIQAIE